MIGAIVRSVTAEMHRNEEKLCKMCLTARRTALYLNRSTVVTGLPGRAIAGKSTLAEAHNNDIPL